MIGSMNITMELTHNTGMRELSLLELDEVFGGACGDFSWRAFGGSIFSTAVVGGLTGALIGGTVSLGVLTVPGWVGGAVIGGFGGGLGYLIDVGLTKCLPE